MMDGECLINEVFCRPALWQAKHKHYKNRGIVDKLWNEVAMALDAPKDDTRAKWKSMRDYYRKELQKVKKTKSGSVGGQMKISNWPFFDLLYFLKEEMTPTLTSSNLDNSSTVPSLGSHEDETQESQLSEQDNEENFDDPDESVDTNLNIPRSETPSRSVSSLSEKYVRKRKTNIQNDVAQKMLLLEEKKLEVLKNNKQEECEDYHFLMSLLPHFKDMPPLQKLTVRNRITQVIIDSKNQYQQSSSFTTFNYNDSPASSSVSPTGFPNLYENNQSQY